MTKGVLIPFNRAGRGEEPRPEGFDSFVEDEGLGSAVRVEADRPQGSASDLQGSTW